MWDGATKIEGTRKLDCIRPNLTTAILAKDQFWLGLWGPCLLMLKFTRTKSIIFVTTKRHGLQVPQFLEEGFYLVLLIYFYSLATTYQTLLYIFLAASLSVYACGVGN